MTLAGRTIAALRSEHDDLTRAAAALSPAQLGGPSGAAEWTVADVFSHLGSGAEITLAGFRAARGETPPPGPDFNQGVWDRWNALAGPDQVAESVGRNAELVAALAALTPAEQEGFTAEIGFAPEPMSLASFTGLRLSEAAQHGWDVRVALDPAAGVDDGSAQVLAEHFAGDLSFLLGFIAKPDARSGGRAVVAVDGTPFSLVLDGRAEVTASAPQATALFTGGLEAAIRLLGGRLTKEHTPPGVTVTGNVTLDDLRAVFPGF